MEEEEGASCLCVLMKLSNITHRHVNSLSAWGHNALTGTEPNWLNKYIKTRKRKRSFQEG